MRSCIECKLFSFSAGQPDYSEWTGGWRAEVTCDATPSQWTIDMEDETEEGFRKKLLMAETCKKFAPWNPLEH